MGLVGQIPCRAVGGAQRWTCTPAITRRVLRGNTASLVGLPDHAAALAG